ncbi:unnamed protein product [Coregonus sp. 'balchen']|nr:unnamed protein product [Coregonus sp. 'balchen']
MSMDSGGFLVAISNTVHPTLQMSDFLLHEHDVPLQVPVDDPVEEQVGHPLHGCTEPGCSPEEGRRVISALQTDIAAEAPYSTQKLLEHRLMEDWLVLELELLSSLLSPAPGPVLSMSLPRLLCSLLVVSPYLLVTIVLVPESEVFEITDFTTASEWERFMSRVEEVLNDWKLIGNNASKPPEKSEYTSGTWEEKTQEINFAVFKFSVTHHYLKQVSEESEGKEEPEEGTVLLQSLFTVPVILSVS